MSRSMHEMLAETFEDHQCKHCRCAPNEHTVEADEETRSVRVYCRCHRSSCAKWPIAPEVRR